MRYIGVCASDSMLYWDREMARPITQTLYQRERDDRLYVDPNYTTALHIIPSSAVSETDFRLGVSDVQMAAVDDLKFQEFDDAENLVAANRDATTISIGDPSGNPRKQRRVAGAAPREEDEDLLGNDDSDKTELLAGQKKSAPFWTFEYYQTFFDVETRQVLDRIKGSILPWPGKNFVRVYIRSNPDLYGPFWICATLVFAIAISGNISSFLSHLGRPKYHYVPEFRKVTIAATAIFSYAWLVPLALWGFLMWRNSKVMNLVSYSFLEIVCVYGYSLFIYIPAAILWIIPSEPLRWISVLIAMGLSGSVLVMTFWPAVRDDHRRIALATVSAIVVLHVLLAVGCKEYFFDSQDGQTPDPNSASVTAKKMQPTAKAQ